MALIIVGAILAYVLFLFAGISLVPKLELRRYHARLRAMPIAELAHEACRSAEAAGIRKQFPDAGLFKEQPAWTWESLAQSLDDLYASMAADDRRSAETGPGSWVYSWYDFGLASIREILDDRRSN